MTPSTYTPNRPPPAVNGGSSVDAPIRVSSVDAPSQPAQADRRYVRYLWVAIRLCMGWTFLWPFMDKMFGLGHDSTSAQAWINGGNPSKGFLSGSIGPFSSFYHSIAGAGIVNALFMVGLLGIALALLLGVAMKPACVAGVTMLVLMWSASLPPDQDIFMDNHIIYALLLVGLVVVGAGKTFGFGKQWEGIGFIQRHRWLA
jgi:thiosulfate dehydrogenase [quinone] large subunit